jgi:hypothetical protein
MNAKRSGLRAGSSLFGRVHRVVRTAFARDGEGFLAKRGRASTRYEPVKVSAPLTIAVRQHHSAFADAYNLKRMRNAFSKNTSRIRGNVETKAGANANDSFRPVC